MKNSNEANHSTNRTPCECKHYWGIHCTDEKHKGKECPIAHFSHCPDFQPKEKKDNENNKANTRIR